jgi:hypothetical protein
MDTTEVQGEQGAFFGSLKRNNKQIRDDRAQTIAEGSESNESKNIYKWER